jgi:hypothetical protein
MSLDATRWAWQQRGLTPSQKLVLLSLADHADQDHRAWPSVGLIEQDTELNRKTVISAISELVAAGLLTDSGERRGKTGRIPVYCLSGVCSRFEKQSQKRNDSENGMVPLFPSNSPKNGTQNLSMNHTAPNGAGADAPDIKTMLWITGERLLGSRPYVGKLIKQHGEPAVFHALAECVSKNPADPRAYIAGLLRTNGAGGASGMPRTREQWASWGQQQKTPAKRGESMDAYVARLQAQYEASHP